MQLLEVGAIWPVYDVIVLPALECELPCKAVLW